MRIIDPQTAVLTNVEVLAHITANPPRRPPNAPPNSRNWVPSPDLRDHNTVVKEIHNYVSRLAPHILDYPRYVHGDPQALQLQQQQAQSTSSSTTAPQVLPPRQPNTPTPMDIALRDLVARLKPFGLTKGEVLMIVNLGVGLNPPAEANGEEGMDVDGGEEGTGEEAAQAEAGGEEGGEVGEGELSEEDYGALALLDTVIEEREERLGNEDVAQVLAIIRETLGSKGAAGE
ncbi:hypothetical protein ASPWEDRAFT_170055 [Aspergillus wentii DTO 134E9]|uniref:DNA-directed RNA polymerase III subunit RPC9 n=1 Tax=Aspergillus wentii DTO 134E9 TaxID=1073089 RepID=A0A1L9RNP1_ASPWE|nr:uncharacterized protein ASPWEDRAFT_170055 [Aspergillus wentii DTO 134E9]KAI9934319.1 hypothetical protein MW887_005393 [Aspergillus wentii]OJJ36541.1 hypothetical protein ASPWEDRAFT_170055 [Aspergillus wentii DTO 134E9]